MSLNSFLSPVVEAIGDILQTKDESGSVIYNDPTVLAVAKIVYGEVVKYCNRPFISQSIIERYPTVDKHFKVRITPLVSITYLKDYNNTTTALVLNTNYTVIGDTIDMSLHSTGISDVLISYTGGLSVPEEGTPLFSALVEQTIASYNTRDIKGFSSFSGQQGTSRNASNNYGSLSSGVMQLLNEYIYEGIGYKL
jgi:hypothetical protein